jgi:hypothetical protein
MARRSAQCVKQRSKKRKYIKKKKFSNNKLRESEKANTESEVTDEELTVEESPLNSLQHETSTASDDLFANNSPHSSVKNPSVVATSCESEPSSSDIKIKFPYKVINKVHGYEAKKKLLKKILNPQMDPYYDSDPLAANFAKWRTLKMRKALLDSAIDRLEKSPI